MRPWCLAFAAALLAAPLRAQQPAPAALPSGPLTLLDAIRIGRERGVAATLARLNARVADERIGERRADVLPTLAGAATYSRQTQNLTEFGISFPGFPAVTDPFSLWRFRIGASQTLFDASAFGRLRAARDSAVAAGLDARAVGELSGATAGLAYLRTLSARETVKAREADSVVAATLLDQARQLVAAGVSPAIDATRSEVSFAAVRTDLELARNAVDRTRLDLLRALDLPPGSTVELADSLGLGAVDLPLDPDSAGRFAREHRAELAAERKRTEAMRRTLAAIRAENLPNVGLSGYYQQSGTAMDGLDGTYQVLVGVNIPILDGFRRQIRGREQRVRLDAQLVRERDLGDQIETEARQAVLDAASARQQVAIAEDRLRLAEQELAQAEERFRAGVAGSVETTNAQSAVIAGRDALIQARVNYSTARVRAYRALGIIDQLQ
ncbi:MAG: TolC family protein [Gemmatimonadota bacterium]|jgi:outer membrane protein TolC